MGLRRDARAYPPPGRIINGLHLNLRGQGSPAVVFEAGIAASSISWTVVQRRVAEWTTTVAYDRPGLGWSLPADGQLNAEGLVDRLRAALRAAGVNGPFLLVGHSFGGLLVRIFAARYPGEVCGLVLVDSALVSEWAQPSEERERMLRLGIQLARRGALLAHLGVVRLGLELAARRSRGLARGIARAASGPGLELIDRMVSEVQKLPAELAPAVKAHWSQAKSFVAMAAYLELLPEVARKAGEVRLAGGMPVAAISSAHASKECLREHRAVASEHVQASRGGHWVQLDEPELVAGTIRRILEQAGATGGLH